ncbi:extracellular solute-binding protein [Pseudonocardia sichuanensis]
MIHRPELSRRRFLGASALGVLSLSACGGRPSAPQVQVTVPQAILDEAAPFRGSTVRMLSQQMYSDLANEALDHSLQTFAEATGTTVENNLMQADTGDVVAKLDAEIASGNARDLAFFTDDRFLAQFHNLGLVNEMTDVVESLTTTLGQPVSESQNFCVYDGKWYGVPYHFVGLGDFVRKDWLQEKGIPVRDTYTYEEMRDICLEISDPAKRRFGWGVTINRSGDGNSFLEGVVNSWGGAITAEDGRTVTFNSPETVDAVAFVEDIFKNPKYQPMRPPGIESWTDSSNNENWLAGIIGYVRNQFSVYADSKTTENPVYAGTHAFAGCTGPATDRPVRYGQSQALINFRGSQNPGLAKVLSKYLVSGTPLLNIAKAAPGLAMPAWEQVWDSDPFYTQGDPAFSMLRDMAQQPLPIPTTTGLGFPGRPSSGRQAVLQSYVLTDMMQTVLQGTTPQAAVASAHERITQIFEQQGLRQ